MRGDWALTLHQRVAASETARESDAVRLALIEAANRAIAVINTAGDATYTAANLAGGLIERDPNGAPRNDTTDSAAAIIAALGLMADGDSRICYLFNASDGVAETITLAGGTGVTVKNPTLLLGVLGMARLLMRRTGASTLALYLGI